MPPTKGGGMEIFMKNNFLSVEDICKFLNYPFRIELYDRVSSTNSLLRDKAKNGILEDTVIIATEQTNGRGRMGKSFFSPANSGLYISILLRPDFLANEALFLTTAAAVATAKAIEDVSDKKALIKWVNDIYIDNKKVCGILTEGDFNIKTNKLNYVIVGIGINLCPPKDDFPTGLSNIATTIFKSFDECGNKQNLLVSNLLNYFMDYYHSFHDKAYFDEYVKRSMILGKNISVISNKCVKNALALDINKDCHLKVRYEDGSEEWLHSGEVSTRPI